MLKIKHQGKANLVRLNDLKEGDLYSFPDYPDCIYEKIHFNSYLMNSEHANKLNFSYSFNNARIGWEPKDTNPLVILRKATLLIEE